MADKILEFMKLLTPCLLELIKIIWGSPKQAVTVARAKQIAKRALKAKV